MLKNELKTTWRPSGQQTGPKWTTHRVSVKLCIKDLLEIQATSKQALPATRHASVFINTVILLNKAFLVIAWRWIHIDFCSYADVEVWSSVCARKGDFHVTQIFRKREAIFYLNKAVTLRWCQLRYWPLVCLYWGFNRLFSGPISIFMAICWFSSLSVSWSKISPSLQELTKKTRHQYWMTMMGTVGEGSTYKPSRCHCLYRVLFRDPT